MITTDGKFLRGSADRGHWKVGIAHGRRAGLMQITMNAKSIEIVTVRRIGEEPRRINSLHVA